MADAATWARRVDEWRASGLTSHAFCAGREFTAGGLRHWSHRLGRTRGRKDQAATPSVRMARVLRVSAPTAPSADVGLVVEVGTARVTVRAGFDRATLDALLDVLSARGVR